MAKILADGLFFCVDCTFAAINGEFPEHAETAQAVSDGLRSLDGYAVMSGEEWEFSWRTCDCCRSGLGGMRYGFSLLGS